MENDWDGTNDIRCRFANRFDRKNIGTTLPMNMYFSWRTKLLQPSLFIYCNGHKDNSMAERAEKISIFRTLLEPDIKPTMDDEPFKTHAPPNHNNISNALAFDYRWNSTTRFSQHKWSMVITVRLYFGSIMCNSPGGQVGTRDWRD